MRYPEMRRHEKKLSKEEAVKIISKADYGVLSLSMKRTPYGVPLSHAISGDSIYFHCANEGFKLDIIKKNPKGHFLFVSKAKTLPQKATVAYKSAMAHGDLRIVTDPKERKKAYKAITDKYMKNFPDAAKAAIEKNDHKTTLVAMDIEGLSAKGAPENKVKKQSLGIASPITIRNITLKNRIVMPPMVVFAQKRAGGFLTKNDSAHYSDPAKYGTGLIVVEATAVDENGLSFKNGLALWDDKFISGFENLTKEVKKHGAAVFIQLQHGGYKSLPEVTSPVSSSDYKDKRHSARALTSDEADALVESFAQAALRAKKAGFDGVQLHGCHGYLINQFSCPAVNHRDDKYAKSSAFGSAIIERTRELCGDDFIISVRVGIDSPTVENSLQTALDYQSAGADMLSVSSGIDTQPFYAPKDWKYSDISYLAYLVKQKVSVPVAGVFGITDRKQANSIIKNKYFDMVAVGRNHLIHPDWAQRALGRKNISKCRKCKKGCYFSDTLKKCPAIETAKKKGLI